MQQPLVLLDIGGVSGWEATLRANRDRLCSLDLPDAAGDDRIKCSSIRTIG